MKTIPILALTITISACGSENGNDMNPKLRDIMQTSPIKDAQLAIAGGDFRFISVHNHFLTMPLNIAPCLVEKFGHFTLSNEDFDYGGYNYQRYGALSKIYGNWYNHEITLYIEEKELDKC
jgi:hypothetical protein